jgi:hypothetical protein
MSFRWYVATAIGLVTASGAAYATEAHYDCTGGTGVAAQFSPPNAANGQVVLTFDGSGSRCLVPASGGSDRV